MIARVLQTSPAFIVWLAFLGFLTSCTTITVQDPFDIMAESHDSGEYRIGPDDVIEVLVWKNADLSKVVTVRPDGKISLPLIGDVTAAGLTVTHVKDDITERLKTFYQDPPQVSLIVQQANSYVIYVLGEVQRPGQYMVKRGTTFLQAIALAEGFTPFAATNEILVLRNSTGDQQQRATKIRYKDILAGKYQENNILLKSGDTIVVP